MFFYDEDDVRWQCIEVNGGSGEASGDSDGKVFRRLRFIRADTPWAVPHEIIVSADLDLNDAAIRRSVLRWASRRV